MICGYKDLSYEERLKTCRFILVRDQQTCPHLDTGELSVCRSSIRPVTVVRDLGVMLESDLSMRGHVARTVGCCFRQLRLLRGCIRSLPFEAARAAVAAFVTSQVDRCNSLLVGTPKCLLDCLQSVLNAAARLLCNRRKYDHVTPLLRDVLHWLPVPLRIEFKICLLVYKSLHGAAPEYICATTVSGRIPPLPGCDSDRSRKAIFAYDG